eukprot:3195953-Pleurochrysis_carterae.AAC.1
MNGLDTSGLTTSCEIHRTTEAAPEPMRTMSLASTYSRRNSATSRELTLKDARSLRLSASPPIHPLPRP